MNYGQKPYQNFEKSGAESLQKTFCKNSNTENVQQLLQVC